MLRPGAACAIAASSCPAFVATSACERRLLLSLACLERDLELVQLGAIFCRPQVDTRLEGFEERLLLLMLEHEILPRRTDERRCASVATRSARAEAVSDAPDRASSWAMRKTAASSEMLRVSSGKKKLTGGTNSSVALLTV